MSKNSDGEEVGMWQELQTFEEMKIKFRFNL